MVVHDRRVFLLLHIFCAFIVQTFSEHVDIVSANDGKLTHRTKRAVAGNRELSSNLGPAVDVPDNVGPAGVRKFDQVPGQGQGAGINQFQINPGMKNINNMSPIGNLMQSQRNKEYPPGNQQQYRLNSKDIKVNTDNRKFPTPVKLSTSLQCKDDVRSFCNTPNMQTNNFAVLDCLQQDLKVAERVSKTCQHFMWQYKKNLTQDERFFAAGKSVCDEQIQKFPDCQRVEPNLMIACMVEYKHNTTGECHTFLNKMASIIFEDYRLIYHFVDKCSDDIGRFQCGGIGGEDEESVHSQGKTLSCLYRHMGQVSPDCKLQVLRVAELQADDYHLDRTLYYACRNDREQFCPEVPAGGGKVFDCLFANKFERTMSVECRKNLVLRQQLIAEDVKVDKTFFIACRTSIQAYHCLRGPQGAVNVKRAAVLLCLENAMKIERKVEPECVAEMTALRESIMADFKITPEIMVACHEEIEVHCNQGLERQGKTIHCLMDLVKRRPQNSQDSHLIGNRCRAELESLLEEADVGSDYRIDRALKRACQPVAQSVCRDVAPGESRVINCLMENMDTEFMTPECEEKLFEIQYFVVRDFRLDPMLYKHCRRDAFNFCHAPENWHDPDSTNPEQGPWTLGCLYRNMKHSGRDSEHQISRACKHEIRRTMRQRARSVSLQPQVEENCLQDLAQFCSDKDSFENGIEMQCLQDNYESLEPKCKEIVGNFTEDEDEILGLDTILMKECTPMIKRFCMNLLEADAEEGDAAEIMECLITNKHHPEMRPKCAVGVEHHQIISLKDFHFSHKFKEACKQPVISFCRNKKTKFEVVGCLSEHVRNDTLQDKPQRIIPECRRQLRFEILQRGESIELDPELRAACGQDISEFCEHVEKGNARVIECLKVKQSSLSQNCHKLLFKREKMEVVMGDYGLNRICGSMIKKYCYDQQQTEQDILDCLKRAKEDLEFDSKCRNIVIRRQIMESHDYRLNPSLIKSCNQDIGKFCNDVIAKERNDDELEGKVIHCLKQKFLEKILSHSCHSEMRLLIKDAHLDIRQDPILILACRHEIEELCSKEFSEVSRSLQQKDQDIGAQGLVEECLRINFQKRKITTKSCKQEIARILHEGQIDVMVDPILHTACNGDLHKWCNDIPTGEGRQMSCLLSKLEDTPDQLEQDCRDKLSERKELWEYAAQIAPVESLQELYATITVSPSRFYLTGILVSIIGVIFIIGISCGRVTKRVSAEMKNR